MADTAPPRPLRHSLAFIFVTMLLDLTGLGIIMPVLPDLIRELTGEGLDRAAVYGGMMLFLYAAIQFVCAPVIGNLSDRFGRRPVLLISLAGFSVDYLIMGLAPTLWLLFVGRALAGIAGATFTTAMAYIADVTPADRRAQSFGLAGVAFGVGFILGPLIGGILGEYGPRVPFYAAAAVAFANFLYGIFVLPESLPRERRRPFDWARANPVGTLTQLRKYPVVIALAGAMLLYQIAHHVYPTIWAYYTRAAFDWSPGQIGVSLAVVGLASAITQGFLIRLIIPRFGPYRTALGAIALGVTAHLCYAFIPHGWMVYPIIMISGFANLAGPSMNGMMSATVPENAQGELQGGLTSIMSLASILSPPMMTQLFATFTGPDAPVYLPGAPFLLAGTLMMLAWITIATRAPRSVTAPPTSSTP